MVYRSDVEALEARVRAAEADLAKRTRARDELAHLLAEARERANQERVQIDAAMGGPARRRLYALLAGGILMLAVIAGAVLHRRYARGNEMAETIHRYSRFADDMCQCRDATCAQHNLDEMTKWATTAVRDRPPPPKIDEASVKRMEKIARRLAECTMKAMAAGSDAPNQARPDHAESQGQ
jgi:hypothetical protein